MLEMENVCCIKKVKWIYPNKSMHKDTENQQYTLDNGSVRISVVKTIMETIWIHRGVKGSYLHGGNIFNRYTQNAGN